jgi:hypothetical protein
MRSKKEIEIPIKDTKNNLREAIESGIEDRKADILRGLSDDAPQDKVTASHD